MHKSAGFNFYARSNIEVTSDLGPVPKVINYKLVWNGVVKEHSKYAAIYEYNVIKANMRSLWSKYPEMSKHYTGSHIRRQMTALFTKVEVRKPWDDKDKSRLIFVVSTLKYIIDKLIYTPVMNSIYGKPPLCIGWSKSRDTMHFLSEHLLGRNSAYPNYYVDGDFSKLDFSLAPSWLTIVAMFPLLFYKRTDTFEYHFLRFLMEWSSDELVSKLLHLFKGQQRMVIGMMFSGSLLTSFGNSLYVIIMFEMWFVHVGAQLRLEGKVAEYNDWVCNWPIRYFVSGDDWLASLPSYTYKYYVGKDYVNRAPGDKPEAFAKFALSAANLTVKMEESRVFDSLYTITNGRGSIRRDGPKFLQRRFVKVRVTDRMRPHMPNDVLNKFIVPWRPIEDYYSRCATTVGGVTLAHYVLKLRGLMVDTAGANYYAYHFIRKIHDGIFDAHPGLQEEVDNLSIQDMQLGCVDFLKRLAGKEYTPEEIARQLPTLASLRNKFAVTNSKMCAVRLNLAKGGVPYAEDENYYLCD